jgi:hypothetical protein
MTGLVFGLILIAAGAAAVRGGSMSRWAGWAAILIGVVQVVVTPLGIDTGPTGLLAYLWIVGVAGYYTFRPGRVRDVFTAPKQSSEATGMPATR